MISINKEIIINFIKKNIKKIDKSIDKYIEENLSSLIPTNLDDFLTFAVEINMHDHFFLTPIKNNWPELFNDSYDDYCKKFDKFYQLYKKNEKEFDDNQLHIILSNNDNELDKVMKMEIIQPSHEVQKQDLKQKEKQNRERKKEQDLTRNQELERERQNERDLKREKDREHQKRLEQQRLERLERLERLKLEQHRLEQEQQRLEQQRGLEQQRHQQLEHQQRQPLEQDLTRNQELERERQNERDLKRGKDRGHQKRLEQERKRGLEQQRLELERLELEQLEQQRLKQERKRQEREQREREQRELLVYLSINITELKNIKIITIGKINTLIEHMTKYANGKYEDFARETKSLGDNAEKIYNHVVRIIDAAIMKSKVQENVVQLKLLNQKRREAVTFTIMAQDAGTIALLIASVAEATKRAIRATRISAKVGEIDGFYVEKRKNAAETAKNDAAEANMKAIETKTKVETSTNILIYDEETQTAFESGVLAATSSAIVAAIAAEAGRAIYAACEAATAKLTAIKESANAIIAMEKATDEMNIDENEVKKVIITQPNLLERVQIARDDTIKWAAKAAEAAEAAEAAMRDINLNVTSSDYADIRSLIKQATEAADNAQKAVEEAGREVKKTEEAEYKALVAVYNAPLKRKPQTPVVGRGIPSEEKAPQLVKEPATALVVKDPTMAEEAKDIGIAADTSPTEELEPTTKKLDDLVLSVESPMAEEVKRTNFTMKLDSDQNSSDTAAISTKAPVMIEVDSAQLALDSALLDLGPSKEQTPADADEALIAADEIAADEIAEVKMPKVAQEVDDVEKVELPEEDRVAREGGPKTLLELDELVKYVPANGVDALAVAYEAAQVAGSVQELLDKTSVKDHDINTVALPNTTGISCYINASIQLLWLIEPIRQYILELKYIPLTSEKRKKLMKSKNLEDKVRQIEEIFYIIKTIFISFQKKKSNPIDGEKLEYIRKFLTSDTSTGQQDAMEIIYKILDNLPEDISKYCKINYSILGICSNGKRNWINRKNIQDSIHINLNEIGNIFYGKQYNIQDMINYLYEDQENDDIMNYNNFCYPYYRKYEKKFYELPDGEETQYIIIDINRTGMNEDREHIKILDEIEPNRIIIIGKYLFILYGCLVHTSDGISGGHYVFIGYNNGHLSYVLDDSTYKKSEEFDSYEKTIYNDKQGTILLYKKIDMPDNLNDAIRDYTSLTYKIFLNKILQSLSDNSIVILDGCPQFLHNTYIQYSKLKEKYEGYDTSSKLSNSIKFLQNLCYELFVVTGQANFEFDEKKVKNVIITDTKLKRFSDEDLNISINKYLKNFLDLIGTIMNTSGLELKQSNMISINYIKLIQKYLSNPFEDLPPAPPPSTEVTEVQLEEHVVPAEVTEEVQLEEPVVPAEVTEEVQLEEPVVAAEAAVSQTINERIQNITKRIIKMRTDCSLWADEAKEVAEEVAEEVALTCDEGFAKVESLETQIVVMRDKAEHIKIDATETSKKIRVVISLDIDNVTDAVNLAEFALAASNQAYELVKIARSVVRDAEAVVRNIGNENYFDGTETKNEMLLIINVVDNVVKDYKEIYIAAIEAQYSATLAVGLTTRLYDAFIRTQISGNEETLDPDDEQTAVEAAEIHIWFIKIKEGLTMTKTHDAILDKTRDDVIYTSETMNKLIETNELAEIDFLQKYNRNMGKYYRIINPYLFLMKILSDSDLDEFEFNNNLLKIEKKYESIIEQGSRFLMWVMDQYYLCVPWEKWKTNVETMRIYLNEQTKNYNLKMEELELLNTKYNNIKTSKRKTVSQKKYLKYKIKYTILKHKINNLKQ